MFDKLRNAFSSATKSFGQKELKEKDIDEVLFELEIALMESDVATEVIDSIKSDLKKKLIGTTIEKEKIESIVKQSLRENISNLFSATGKIDILSNIQKKKGTGEPYIILFVGINGTGKTTTLAKVAHLLQQNKFSVVIAAADTYRAGAIEQLSEHAKRLNLKIIAQNYGSDPAAVARDAVLYAKSHKVDCILIDTAGRMQTSKNLMDQISKINKVVNPDLRIFVGDSLAGNDTVNQAREFHQYTKFEGAILTKSDADARGGAAISIVKITSTPILYLGVGQEYKDLKIFDKDAFLESILGLEESIQIQTAKIETQLKPQEQDNVTNMEKIEQEVKQEPKVILATPEIKVETKQEPKSTSNQDLQTMDQKDPFENLSTKDIEKYSKLFDIRPPENDKEAMELATKIRKWISQGRPKTELLEEQQTMEQDDTKPKKKRSLFGWSKK
ncbi:MAG TPA: signal recognition particle-docking protein FtsY [Nitrosopumilaceae archaeon]|nr:signal recognition particle-docking protein FtsY [Nitrosopumilaceae archaeon]